jgi:hypothetical protein
VTVGGKSNGGGGAARSLYSGGGRSGLSFVTKLAIASAKIRRSSAGGGDEVKAGVMVVGLSVHVGVGPQVKVDSYAVMGTKSYRISNIID